MFIQYNLISSLFLYLFPIYELYLSIPKRPHGRRINKIMTDLSGFRIKEMYIQYNYISNLFTYTARGLS